MTFLLDDASLSADGEATKTCFRCHRKLPLTEFYRHKGMLDGHLNKCKECARRDAHEHRAKNVERFRQSDRARANAPSRVAARKRWQEQNRDRSAIIKRRWISRNPIKRRAHIIVWNTIRSGRLSRQPCAVCGNTKAHAHHPDYAKPLDVIWLCSKHHAEWHAQNGEGLNACKQQPSK